MEARDYPRLSHLPTLVRVPLRNTVSEQQGAINTVYWYRRPPVARICPPGVLAEVLIKEPTERLNTAQVDPAQGERSTLSFINLIGQLLEERVVQGIRKPAKENRLVVGEKVVV